MILQGAWIAALFLVLASQSLPGGALRWTAIAVALFAGAAAIVPHPAWPYLGGALLAIAVANLLRLHFRSGGRPTARRASEARQAPQAHATIPVGQTATLTKAIRGGYGMVTIGNESWVVSSDDDAPEGTRVQVVGADGDYLTVVRTE